MELFVLGTSHSVAPAPQRERMHVELDEVYAALDRIRRTKGGLAEAIPLTTCGRLEIYGASLDPVRDARLLRTLLARATGVARADVRAHSYLRVGPEAVQHLFRVAAGLDSVVHGEAQILGQVRSALEHPSSSTTAGSCLQRLFHGALRAGKRVRTETEIGKGAASVASAAVALIRRQVGELEDASGVVIGAGDTGALIGRLLTKAGVADLVVVNRTPERARALAVELGCEAAALEALPTLLTNADFVVGAAAAPDRLLSPTSANGSIRARASRPLHLFDLAHPGNFDPALGEVPGVRLFDLDHVFQRAEDARAVRASQIPRAEEIVAEDVEAFMAWLRARESAPAVRAIREHFLEVAEAEAARMSRGAGAPDREQMSRLARALARTLLHSPTVALREADPATSEGRHLIDSATVLFGVSPPEPNGHP